MSRESHKAPVILLVEDEDALVELMQRALEKEGYRVLSTGKAGQANVFLINQKFSCVLMDIHLAQGFGDQIINSIRRDKKHTNFDTSVLVISGNLDHHLLESLKGKISGALIKPFSLEHLVQRVNAVTGFKKPAAI